MSDEQEEAAAAAGDLDAFERLVHRHQAAVRAWLLLRTPPDLEVDDLLQQSFLIAYERLASFRGGSSLRTWLIGIAHNCLRAELRARRRRCAVPLGAAQQLLDQRALAAPINHDPALRALRACLRELDAPLVQLLDARYRDGRELASIAADAQRPTGTIKRRLHEARRLLAACVRRRLQTGEAQ